MQTVIFGACLEHWIQWNLSLLKVVMSEKYFNPCTVVRRPRRKCSDYIFAFPSEYSSEHKMLCSSDPLAQHAEHLLLSHKCLYIMCSLTTPKLIIMKAYEQEQNYSHCQKAFPLYLDL